MNNICGKNELKRDYFTDDLSVHKRKKGKKLKDWLYGLCIGRGCIGRGCVIYRSRRLRSYQKLKVDNSRYEFNNYFITCTQKQREIIK